MFPKVNYCSHPQTRRYASHAPCGIFYTPSTIIALIEQIKSLDGENKVCMEPTGKYYEPVVSWLYYASIFVTAVNSTLIRNFEDDSLRITKTDEGDSKKSPSRS